MLFSEYINLMRDIKIIKEKVQAVQRVYAAEYPELVKKILSDDEDTVFFDDEKRRLSKKEILNASQHLEVDFTEKKIIPLFDFYDNDFLVFDYLKGIWEMFNVSDMITFDLEEDIKNILT